MRKHRYNHFCHNTSLHLLHVGIAYDNKRINAFSDGLAVSYECVELVIPVDEPRAKAPLGSDVVIEDQNVLLPVLFVPEELRCQPQRQLLL